MVMEARDRDGELVGVGEDLWWRRRRGGRKSQQGVSAGVGEGSGKSVCKGRAKIRDVQVINRGNIATFRFNVATFSRVKQPTSRRCREAIFQCRDVGIQRRDVPEEGRTDVVTLGSNVTTFQGVDLLTSRR